MTKTRNSIPAETLFYHKRCHRCFQTNCGAADIQTAQQVRKKTESVSALVVSDDDEPVGAATNGSAGGRLFHACVTDAKRL